MVKFDDGQPWIHHNYLPQHGPGQNWRSIVSVMHFPLLLEALYNKIEEDVH
jgi:hypothetical protein